LIDIVEALITSLASLRVEVASEISDYLYAISPVHSNFYLLYKLS